MNDANTRDRLTLFVATFLVLAVGSFWGLPSPGGKSIAGALAILAGGVPYRDFWTMYAPGQFYLVAVVFWMFGRELLVQAMAVSLVRAASAVVFMTLLRRLGATRHLSLSLSAVFGLMFWTTGPELNEYPPALLLLLLSLDRVVRYFRAGGTRHLVAAGLWIGLAACFKHDVAAYVAAGTALSLFLTSLVIGDRRPAGWQSPVIATATIASCALAAVAPLGVWTAWTAGPDAWEDLFVFPAAVFHQVRGEAFPPLIPDLMPLVTWLSDVTNERNALSAAQSLSTWIVLNAPQVVFLLGAGVVLRANRQLDPAAIATLVLLLVCMPFFWAAAHIQPNTHPSTLAILSAGIGVTVWSALEDRTGWKERLSRPLMVAIAVYTGGLLVSPAIKAALVVYEWPGSRAIDLPGLRGIRIPARHHEPFDAIGRFFRTHTRPDEPIYTGLLRHDSIAASDPMLYMVAGRPPCCGFTELHPGVTDRAPIQREIVQRLEDQRVRAMALWEFGWSPSVMEARKQRTMAAVPDAGSTILDRYIAEHFEVVASHGEYHILWRRDIPLPEHVGLAR